MTKRGLPAKPATVELMKRREKKRALFIEAYLVNGHRAGPAARSAGYKGSDQTVAVRGAEFMMEPEVRTEIDRRMREVVVAAQMSTENWARAISAISFATVGDLYDAEGNLIPIHLLPKHVQAAVASITRLDDGTMLPRLAEKAPALGMMAKHLGLFERDNAQKAENVRVIVQLVG